MDRDRYIKDLAVFFEGGSYPNFANYGLSISEALLCEDEALALADHIKSKDTEV